jgi:alkylation response protein AidB-like acyl-CoA dehydrogenase
MSLADVLSTLDRVCDEVVGPEAANVDRSASYPQHSIDALQKSGMLGLISAPEVGGQGLGIGGAARVVERIARSCGSTAMITCMHYAGAAVIEAQGPRQARDAIAAGHHLSTLAFSEVGSRSHFWAPTSTATASGDDVVLDGRKSWATSANHATAYVWSSRPVAAEGMSTLWLVNRGTPGLSSPAAFDGLGLRGNDSAPITADHVRVPGSARLGEDGKGFDTMMGVVLPIFCAMNAACSVGLMDAAIAATAKHATGTAYEHLNGTTLADLPTIRAYIARMKIRADQARTLWEDTLAALAAGRPDAMLRVLEVKASAGEAAIEVTSTAMRVCGGAAYRKEVGVERMFRDAQAAGVMGPTTDVLYDFIGKAVCALPLF